MVGETSYTLTGIWTMTRKWTSGHYILHHHAPVLKKKKKKKPVSRKNALGEAETILNFIKSQPSNTCFLISWGTKREGRIKHFCTANMTAAPGKHLCNC